MPLYISMQAGFYLFIENATSFPLFSTPILLSTGYGRHIQVKRNSYNQYPTPYSDCQVLEEGNELLGDLADRKVFDLTLATNYSYSRDACLTICAQMLNKEACGCQVYENYLLRDGTEFYKAGFTCVTNASDAFDFCISRCPLECSRPEYQKVISKYIYPTNYFDKYESVLNLTKDFVGNQLNDIDMAKFMYDTFVEFSVSYDSTQNAEYIEMPKMSGQDLLGVLGGHFHLFLGMSLMSFFEILELLVIIFCF